MGFYFYEKKKKKVEEEEEEEGNKLNSWAEQPRERYSFKVNEWVKVKCKSKIDEWEGWFICSAFFS